MAFADVCVTWRAVAAPRFIVALVQVKTVSLSQVASVFAGRAKRESHYKRAQRFLRLFDLPFAEVARLVARLATQPAPWVITSDRTDWYLGRTPLNVLLLGIAHEGVTFPVLWAVLPKKGCCDTAERIALIEEYLRLFGRSSIRFLCADREFVGLDWFSYLRRERILNIRLVSPDPTRLPDQLQFQPD